MTQWILQVQGINGPSINIPGEAATERGLDLCALMMITFQKQQMLHVWNKILDWWTIGQDAAWLLIFFKALTDVGFELCF